MEWRCNGKVMRKLIYQGNERMGHVRVHNNSHHIIISFQSSAPVHHAGRFIKCMCIVQNKKMQAITHTKQQYHLTIQFQSSQRKNPMM